MLLLLHVAILPPALSCLRRSLADMLSIFLAPLPSPVSWHEYYLFRRTSD